MEFGVVVPARDIEAIADAVITLLARIKHRPLLDNSKCFKAIDIANIARRIRRFYGELLED